MKEGMSIIKPGIGLGGAAIENAVVGQAIAPHTPVTFATGYLDRSVMPIYHASGFQESDIAVEPSLDRFDPNHTIGHITAALARVADTDRVMVSQPMQSPAFARAVADLFATARTQKILRIQNPFPDSQLEVFQSIPADVECWTVNPGHNDYLAQINPDLRYRFVPSPVSAERIEQEAHPGEADYYAHWIRSGLGLTHEDIMMFQPTRVHRFKDIHLSIELAQLLQDRIGGNVYLVLAGGNEQLEDSRKYEEEVKEYAAEIGFHNLMTMGGIQQDRTLDEQFRMTDFYNACDVVISPSRVEAASRTLTEAAIAKKPIVTTRFGDEFLEDSYSHIYPDLNAIIVEDPYNIEAAAAALDGLLDKPDELKEIAEHNRKAVDHLTTEAFVESVPTLLKRAA